MENDRSKIFIVDDNISLLTAGRDLLKPFYDVYPAKSADELFIMLDKVLPDLILLDIEMPDINGYETLRRLKSNERFNDIPVIFLTARGDEGSELQGFDFGAVDYISKPFSPPILKKRIENQLLILRQRRTIQFHADHLTDLVNERTYHIFKLQSAILSTISDLVEFRDKFTGLHITRTQRYLEILLHRMLENEIYTEETRDWNMVFILPSAQLHDVGKIAIPDVILNKPAKLTPEEFDVIKTHVTVGVEAVKRIMSNAPDHAFLYHALRIVETHHEKWDGTGYPYGLKGKDIPLEGRAMAIVDVYDALVSWRPYKKAYSHEQAVQIIQEERGRHFDPVLLDLFLDIEDEFKNITQKSSNRIL